MAIFVGPKKLEISVQRLKIQSSKQKNSVQRLNFQSSRQKSRKSSPAKWNFWKSLLRGRKSVWEVRKSDERSKIHLRGPKSNLRGPKKFWQNLLNQLFHWILHMYDFQNGQKVEIIPIGVHIYSITKIRKPIGVHVYSIIVKKIAKKWALDWKIGKFVSKIANFAMLHV